MSKKAVVPCHGLTPKQDMDNLTAGTPRCEMCEIKTVTAINGHKFEVDISDEACGRFGFKSGDRVYFPYANLYGVVEGVAPMPEDPNPDALNALWLLWDGDDGVLFVPNPKDNLTLVKR